MPQPKDPRVKYTNKGAGGRKVRAGICGLAKLGKEVKLPFFDDYIFKLAVPHPELLVNPLALKRARPRTCEKRGNHWGKTVQTKKGAFRICIRCGKSWAKQTKE